MPAVPFSFFLQKRKNQPPSLIPHTHSTFFNLKMELSFRFFILYIHFFNFSLLWGLYCGWNFPTTTTIFRSFALIKLKSFSSHFLFFNGFLTPFFQTAITVGKKQPPCYIHPPFHPLILLLFLIIKLFFFICLFGAFGAVTINPVFFFFFNSNPRPTLTSSLLIIKKKKRKPNQPPSPTPQCQTTPSYIKIKKYKEKDLEFILSAFCSFFFFCF